MDTVGERIKEIRKKFKFTQAEFAKELGISQNHISSIENGKENPSPLLLKFIGFKFDVNEDWIATGIGAHNISPNMEDLDDLDKLTRMNYNRMRVIFDRYIRERSDKDLNNTEKAFSRTVGLLSAGGVNDENVSKYLELVCKCISTIEQQQHESYCLKNFGKLNTVSSSHRLLVYKDESKQRIDNVVKYITEISNIYLEQLDSQSLL